ncbi:hypothetical protein ANCDUO_14849 [Ancylostoma duodenale]|uniref:Uncharacterized protein n=1 Tax=Ancylostoma duodenale TaxID=51022 RepID=A0A0C2CF93_9BILA|nr:hypothetical protein ANCDUO_14849 [Ancylostoma duodenale]
MSEGLSYLASFVRRYYDIEHLWTQPYAAFSGDCPIYRQNRFGIAKAMTYETKDKKWVAVGALEPKFNSTLFEILGMDKNMADMYADPAGITAEMEQIFKSKTRDEWMTLFEGKNACVSPVLNLDEAVQFRHNIERENFVKEGNKCFPQPAPRMYTKEEFKKLKSRL